MEKFGHEWMSKKSVFLKLTKESIPRHISTLNDVVKVSLKDFFHSFDFEIWEYICDSFSNPSLPEIV